MWLGMIFQNPAVVSGEPNTICRSCYHSQRFISAFTLVTLMMSIYINNADYIYISLQNMWQSALIKMLKQEWSVGAILSLAYNLSGLFIKSKLKNEWIQLLLVQFVRIDGYLNKSWFHRARISLLFHFLFTPQKNKTLRLCNGKLLSVFVRPSANFPNKNT